VRNCARVGEKHRETQFDMFCMKILRIPTRAGNRVNEMELCTGKAVCITFVPDGCAGYSMTFLQTVNNCFKDGIAARN
jgi:hypothetical protein